MQATQYNYEISLYYGEMKNCHQATITSSCNFSFDRQFYFHTFEGPISKFGNCTVNIDFQVSFSFK